MATIFEWENKQVELFMVARATIRSNGWSEKEFENKTREKERDSNNGMEECRQNWEKSADQPLLIVRSYWTQ